MNISRVGICLYSQKLRSLQLLSPFFFWKRCVSYLGKWEEPTGYNVGITIYNSAVNTKVSLVLRRKDTATWYMCGPTVYAESHIGHASCYVKFDIIRRILENIFNINVIVLLGITDVDDKIIKKANKAELSTFELSKKFELDFFKDMDTLRVLPPSAVSRVSENIPLIISFCNKLIEKEYAYATVEGNVYFMVSKGVSADILQEMPEERISNAYSDPLKRDPRDFVLWKAAKPNEPFWESPWGKGRPGWHIECSAMASKMFGSELDLHSGGYDLLFPHHTNEKSQSEAYHGCCQWVNYWLHSGLLQVSDELKMSKSLNNTISIKDFLLEHSVNDFRILCVQSSYRKNLFYNSQTLAGAKGLHKKLHHFINDCELYVGGETMGPIIDGDNLLSKLTSTKEQVVNSLGNDFNSNQALLYLTDLVDEINKSLPPLNASHSVVPEDISTIFSCYSYVNNILEILGISIISKRKIPRDIVFLVDTAVELRNKIRLFSLDPKGISKCYDSGDDQTCSYYVDNTYGTFENKLNITLHAKETSSYISNITETSKNFYEEALRFAKVFDDEKALYSLDQVKPKDARKKMSPLFTICDNFRSNLSNYGIGIKDRGVDSLWIPLIELQGKLHQST